MNEAPILGIDLGTTYSVISCLNEHGQPEVIANTDDGLKTPSVVFFESSDNILVGETAKDAIEHWPEDVVSFVKREIGRNKDEVRKEENYGEPKPYDFFGYRYSPEEITSTILSYLKSSAELRLGVPSIHKVVITVPAYFNDFERNSTIKAGEIAGLEVVRVLNEPTAAAIAYGVNLSVNQKTFVFDLGGGTFDVSIVDIRDGACTVIASDGDHRLGGKDWDDKIIGIFAEKFIEQHGIDPRDNVEAMGELRRKAEPCKKLLSSQNSASISMSVDGHRLELDISRQEFEEACLALISRVEGLCDFVLRDASLEWGSIEEIALVGGSTRLPMVRKLIEEMSGKQLPTNLVNPDTCVAMGAALVAGTVDSKVGNLPARHAKLGMFSDVAAHSLGFVTVKGSELHNSRMIEKNQKIPYVSEKEFTTLHDSQKTLEILILQGESERPSNCTMLEGYEFSSLPKAKKGSQKVKVSFKYNDNGVVEVTASILDQALPFTKITNPALPEISPARSESMSLIIAIDLSGSMNGKPIRDAQAAAKKFVTEMNLDYTQIELMCFADKVKVSHKFSSVKQYLFDAIDAWNDSSVGYGNNAEPFTKCLDRLQGKNGRKLVIVLTDGVWAYPDEAKTSALTLKRYGAEIMAIGFGGADEEFLRTLSSSQGGHSFVRTSAELGGAMLNLATEINENRLGAME